MLADVADTALDEELARLRIPGREAVGLARTLARAETRGRSGTLVKARRELRDAGLTEPEALHAALVLLALGLRERGIPHLRVADRLRAHGDLPAAEAAALDSARIVRRALPDLEPARLDALRRRASLLIFAASALWGALAAQLLRRVL